MSVRDELADVIDRVAWDHMVGHVLDHRSAECTADAVLAHLGERGIDVDGTLTRAHAREDADARGDS